MFNFNIIQIIWSSLTTAVTYFSLPDDHFSPSAVFVNLQIFVFSLPPPEVCSGLVVLAFYFSLCFSLQLLVWYLLLPNQSNHLKQIYLTCTAQSCHQFQLLASQLLFFSFSSFISSLFFLSAFSAWSLAKWSSSYLDQEALIPTIHEWLGTSGRHQHAKFIFNHAQCDYRFFVGTITMHIKQSFAEWKSSFRSAVSMTQWKDTLSMFSQLGILFSSKFINYIFNPSPDMINSYEAGRWSWCWVKSTFFSSLSPVWFLVCGRGRFQLVDQHTILHGFPHFERNAVDSLSHSQHYVWISIGKLNQEHSPTHL